MLELTHTQRAGGGGGLQWEEAKGALVKQKAAAFVTCHTPPRGAPGPLPRPNRGPHACVRAKQQSPSARQQTCVCVCIYIYLCVCVCMCVWLTIHNLFCHPQHYLCVRLCPEWYGMFLSQAHQELAKSFTRPRQQWCNQKAWQEAGGRVRDAVLHLVHSGHHQTASNNALWWQLHSQSYDSNSRALACFEGRK